MFVLRENSTTLRYRSQCKESMDLDELECNTPALVCERKLTRSFSNTLIKASVADHKNLALIIECVCPLQQ